MEPAIPKMMTMAYETVENMVDYGVDRAVETARQVFPHFTKKLLTDENARTKLMDITCSAAMKHVVGIMHGDGDFEYPRDARAARVSDEFGEFIFFLTSINSEFAVWESFVEIQGVTYRIGFSYGD